VLVREQHDPGGELLADDGVQQGDPVHVGHLMVDDRDRGALALDRLERLAPAPCLRHNRDLPRPSASAASPWHGSSAPAC
jgi:hypothetical protein